MHKSLWNEIVFIYKGRVIIYEITTYFCYPRYLHSSQI